MIKYVLIDYGGQWKVMTQSEWLLSGKGVIIEFSYSYRILEEKASSHNEEEEQNILTKYW